MPQMKSLCVLLKIYFSAWLNSSKGKKKNVNGSAVIIIDIHTIKIQFWASNTRAFFFDYRLKNSQRWTNKYNLLLLCSYYDTSVSLSIAILVRFGKWCDLKLNLFPLLLCRIKSNNRRKWSENVVSERIGQDGNI